jgi:DNA polymerase
VSFLSIDFETRSQIDLRKTGVYPYAEHPSTDVWCMSYAVPGAQPKTWFPGDPVPPVFYECIRRGLPFRAWNASFEHIIYRDIMVPRYGFPAVPMGIWVDTAAEAAALSLPRGLGQCAQVLGMAAQKDDEGYRLMMKMCRPRAVGAWWITHPSLYTPNGQGAGPFATKNDADAYRKMKGWKPRECSYYQDTHTVVWWDDPADIARLAQYCEQDVATEMALAEVLRDLSPEEREVYLLTQRMNDRGVGVDMQLVDAAADLNDAAMQQANARLLEITGGLVQGVTQVHSMRRWLADHGIDLPDLRKDTVRDTLNDEQLVLAPEVREVLQIRQDAGKTSTAKLAAFEACVASDGRAHGLILYHGASTGRWSGKLIQPQNFPRPSMDVEPLIPLIQGRVAQHADRVAGVRVHRRRLLPDRGAGPGVDRRADRPRGTVPQWREDLRDDGRVHLREGSPRDHQGQLRAADREEQHPGRGLPDGARPVRGTGPGADGYRSGPGLVEGPLPQLLGPPPLRGALHDQDRDERGGCLLRGAEVRLRVP